MKKLKGTIGRHRVAKVLYNMSLMKRFRGSNSARDEMYADARAYRSSAATLENVMDELNLPKPCRCDSCEYKVVWTLGEDEVGSGNQAERCYKKHWDSNGPQSKEEEKKCAPCKEILDIWADCKDFDTDWREIKGKIK